MPVRKKAELTEPFDYDTAYAQLAHSMTSLHISRIDEMPRIDLYLDQVLSIVSMELAPLYGDDEKIITGSMVNNYVKQRVMPAPTRKRYTRYHLAALLFVCALKRVLSIAQVALMLQLCRDANVDITNAYDRLSSALEQTLAARFGNTTDGGSAWVAPVTVVDLYGEPVTGELPSLLQSAIGLIANKVYVEKLLALEALREKDAQTE